MSISSRWVDCCPPTGLPVLVWSAATFSSFVYVSVYKFNRGIDTKLWMDLVHPRVSPFLLSVWCFRDQTRHLFRFPGWTVVHPRVSPFLIIGFLVLVGFVGCPCCFQLLLSPILSSNYLWRKSLEAEVTHIFLVCDFSRFHHNNFRDTISWECIVKDDCITSCLIEFESFTLSKLQVDPIHRVLVFFFSFSACTMQDVVWSNQVLVRIFVFLVHGIHSREDYCLSFLAWILSSRYQSWICDGV